jgi:hypothetical protein
VLLLFRGIAALGIGGEWAAGAAMVAEVVPEHRRVEAGALLWGVPSNSERSTILIWARHPIERPSSNRTVVVRFRTQGPPPPSTGHHCRPHGDLGPTRGAGERQGL